MSDIDEDQIGELFLSCFASCGRRGKETRRGTSWQDQLLLPSPSASVLRRRRQIKETSNGRREGREPTYTSIHLFAL